MTERPKIGMVSQLILRNAERLRTGQVLLINPPRDSGCSKLSQDQRRVSVFSQDFADYNYMKSTGAEVEFGLIPSMASSAQDIVLILPRERERLEMLLHAISSSMPPPIHPVACRRKPFRDQIFRAKTQPIFSDGFQGRQRPALHTSQSLYAHPTIFI